MRPVSGTCGHTHKNRERGSAELLLVTRRSCHITSLLALRMAFFLLKKLIIGQLVNKFCAFYVTRVLIDLLHKDLLLAIVGSLPESILERVDSDSA